LARLYQDKPAITSRAAWDALIELSWPSLPWNIRRQFETAIAAGKTITAP
jgi:hypothetical protein